MDQITLLYDELIKKITACHPDMDLSMIEKAYQLASEAHGDQRRKSGEPYIIHPLSVAIILADLELDNESIVAGILHDVVEDTKYSREDIAEIFNEDVALLVDGVTKLEKIAYVSKSKEEFQADNFRKMVLSMAKDIRVILIKVADRLHNMRTLNYMKPEKQKEIARETLDIYAPLADRLGISTIKVELEDLSLKYLDSEAYYDLVEKIKHKQSERESFVKVIVDSISEKCAELGIKCEVYGRPKHFFSIYKKMHNKNKTLDQIYDLFAVRILVDTVTDCYAALGVVHEIYKPIPNRFKDYISMPKANMYQSLHNTLIGPEGTPFEIQIRTYEMHRIAEYGIAAHWKYKEGKIDGEQSSDDVKLSWLRQILEWQSDMADNKEFMESVKTDLDVFNENVYCFSPDGRVVSLLEGSTPVDFAYAIHSAIGNTMISARVNGRIVTIDYRLKNGDRVEILTSQNSKGPSMDWLKFVRTSQARNKINQWYKKVNKEENIIRGRELLEKEARRKSYDILALSTPEAMESVLNRYSFRDWDSICAAVGHGGLKEGQVVNRLIEIYLAEEKKHKTADQLMKEQEEALMARVDSAPVAKKRSKSGVYVHGIGDIEVRLSRCCTPVPGDEIVGFVTRGRGVSIHRTDCVNIINLNEEERARLLEAEWAGGSDTKAPNSFGAEIRVFAMDRDGLTMDILKVLMDDSVPVNNVSARAGKHNDAVVNLSITITGREQLEIICKKIQTVKGVENIQRVTT